MLVARMARIGSRWLAPGLSFGIASLVVLAPLPLAAEPSQPAIAADMAVTVARTKRVCFADSIQVTGVLVPKREVLVRPDREGLQISQVLVEPGDTVVSGQVLARLTPPDGQSGGGAGLAVQAPAAGVISARFAVIGSTATARAEPLFRIVAQGEMELLAEVSARRHADIAPDQSAKIEIVGVGELAGKVRLVSQAINPATQLGEVRVFIGSDSRLRVGAFGRATINVGQRCAAAVPLSAVLYGTEGAVVQVVRDNQIETRRVNVGLLGAGQVEIRDGLAVGEMVVARAGAFLREGDRVRPVPVGESPARQ
jgi:HlyD family secretion protein